MSRPKYPPACPPRFRVGDRVRFQLGRATIVGTVVEDRGPLGVGGERIYDVQYDRARPHRSYSEVPESELEAADGRTAPN